MSHYATDLTMEEKATEGIVSAVSSFLEWETSFTFSARRIHHLPRLNPQPRSKNSCTVCNHDPCAQVDDTSDKDLISCTCHALRT
jgi:hypothetical protein